MNNIESIKVEAFNEGTGKSVGIFDSICKCARTLSVNNRTVWSCLFNTGRHTTTSKKSKIKYSFKLIKS